MLSMKLIASREMAAKPSALWKALKKEGAIVVTKNGQPEGVFFSTSGETWLEDVQEVIFARARSAATEMRKTAAQSGASSLSDEEVETEIRNSRKERRK
jgi:hypothetical protein